MRQFLGFGSGKIAGRTFRRGREQAKRHGSEIETAACERHIKIQSSGPAEPSVYGTSDVLISWPLLSALLLLQLIMRALVWCEDCYRTYSKKTTSSSFETEDDTQVKHEITRLLRVSFDLDNLIDAITRQRVNMGDSGLLSERIVGDAMARRESNKFAAGGMSLGTLKAKEFLLPSQQNMHTTSYSSRDGFSVGNGGHSSSAQRVSTTAPQSFGGSSSSVSSLNTVLPNASAVGGSSIWTGSNDSELLFRGGSQPSRQLQSTTGQHLRALCFYLFRYWRKKIGFVDVIPSELGGSQQVNTPAEDVRGPRNEVVTNVADGAGGRSEAHSLQTPSDDERSLSPSTPTQCSTSSTPMAT
jgi:hypothetical protein